MRAKGTGDLFKSARLGIEPGMELVALDRRAIGVDAGHRLFHRLPTTVVKHHRQNRQLVLLGHGVNGGGGRKMKPTVTLDVNDAGAMALLTHGQGSPKAMPAL